MHGIRRTTCGHSPVCFASAAPSSILTRSDCALNTPQGNDHCVLYVASRPSAHVSADAERETWVTSPPSTNTSSGSPRPLYWLAIVKP